MKTNMLSLVGVVLAAALPGAAEEARPVAAPPPETALFDGKTLAGWKVVDFYNPGKIAVKEDGVLEIGRGSTLTGLVYTNEPVRMNYEISLEGRRVEGNDFFCGLTFPVASNSCTLILGGWGGGLIGMSSIDGMDASENQTSQWVDLESNRWYTVRLRVTPGKVEAWLDSKKFVDLETEGRRLGMRAGDIEMCVPLGLATWQTKGELRHMRLRRLPAP